MDKVGRNKQYLDLDCNMRDYSTCLGDSFHLIKEVPDASVDLILTDPPYNLGLYSKGNIRMKWRKEINNKVANWDHEIFKPHKLVHDFKRILKPNGNIFSFTSYNLLGQWHDAFDKEFNTFQFIVWHKTNPTPKIRQVGFLNSCELIVCLWNSGHVWNFLGQKHMHNFIESSICMGSERIKNPAHHPTQKPVKILEHLITIASNEGNIVFDPFMGVGSTGVAALHLKRRFLGFEIDKNYFISAKERLEKTSLYIKARNKGNYSYDSIKIL